MATIKAIEGHSVHQIQSGQVIVDLNSVVKELVENSLDARATSIEVRFKNQGLDCIEVQDNGKGISPDDYDTVALKHHTSKLASYEDLTSLDTFGFRGEALSSLCALSKFHILTARLEDGAVGRRLDFDVSGKLKSTTVTAAQKGTTVSVDAIFCNLPVRRKELEKNIKREYGKVIGLLHQYACICVGVRFSVSNQMPKGKKTLVFSTKLNTTTKENIVNVFGAKTLLALIKLDLALEMQPSAGPSAQSARSWSSQAIGRSSIVRVEGHISKPVFGEGRQAPDRQMFFVNSRPCQLPQVAKAINEVYKSFNSSQSPFIFANLILDTDSYDVNVSPDKRTILLHDQSALLESLKARLTELFEQTDHTVPQSTLPNRKLPAYQPLNVCERRVEAVENGSNSEERAEESEDDSVSKRPAPAAPVKRMSDGSAEDTPPNLMQGWLGRNTEGRSQMPPPQKSSTEMSKDNQNLVKHLRKLFEDKIVSSSTGEAERPPGMDGSTDVARPDANQVGASANSSAVATGKGSLLTEPDPLSTPHGDLFSQRPVSAAEMIEVADNAISETEQEIEEPGSDDDTEPGSNANTEPQIAAIAQSSQKHTPGPVQNAFDRMRPKRTPLQTAEITIGDTTTTTVIGNGGPAYKKRRVHTPKDSQAYTKFAGSPLLARGLRNFAAPGSQLEDETVDGSDIPPEVQRAADDEESNGASDDSDEAMSDGEQAAPADRAAPAHVPQEESSDPLDQLLPAPADDDDELDDNELDEDYIDEDEKRMREDERVARLIQKAEEAAVRPTEANLKRASRALRGGNNRKDSTLQLSLPISTSLEQIRRQASALATDTCDVVCSDAHGAPIGDELDSNQAETKLSLTVTKSDFANMHVVGQFNLGFILALRPPASEHDQAELFIIDQHAADEKYNYERLQRTVTLESQRLVRPKALELSAVEEEIILNNSEALKANGFEIEVITSPDNDARSIRLLTLPISGNQTFTPSDLEELLHLLAETSAGGPEIPRPRKVQKILAMRACRSSIMVGKTLTGRQMEKVMRHLGEMEKPWNCPHGRPTMRHLAGLGGWEGWREGGAIDAEDEDGGMMGGGTDWKGWLAGVEKGRMG